jgi:hypothetical protein
MEKKTIEVVKYSYWKCLNKTSLFIWLFGAILEFGIFFIFNNFFGLFFGFCCIGSIVYILYDTLPPKWVRDIT